MREHFEEMGDVFRWRGRAGLEAILHIGAHLSAAIAAVSDVLATRVAHRRRRLSDAPSAAPPVELLLEIDRTYRARGRRSAPQDRAAAIQPHEPGVAPGDGGRA